MTEKSNVYFFKNERFQTARIGCFFRLPLTQKNLSFATLLSMYQGNVSQRYATMQAQSRRLAELYDINLSIFPQVRGNQIILQYQFEWIEPELILDKQYTLEQISEFFSAIVLEPLFDVADDQMFRLTVDELLTEIDSFFDSPDNVAFYEFFRKYYSDRPDYGVTLFGDQNLLSKIKIADLQTFHEKLLKQPVLVVGTAKNELELKKAFTSQLVDHLFGITEPFAYPNLFVAPSSLPKQEVLNEFGAQQAQLLMGFSFAESVENKWIINVFSQYLGGNESSILFQKVREKLGAAYAVDSINYNYNNLLVVSAGLQKTKVEQSKQIITEAITAIAAGHVDEKIFNQAQKALIRQRRMMGDRQKNLVSIYVAERLRNIPQGQDVEKLIKQVQKADLVRFAQLLTLKESYILE